MTARMSSILSLEGGQLLAAHNVGQAGSPAIEHHQPPARREAPKALASSPRSQRISTLKDKVELTNTKSNGPSPRIW